jgi:nanoRNase/pAp phosphatase (c-di-AMP/oligoRNAs hydrolase)
MQSVQVARHTGVCHIGTIPYPEVVAEIADFLVAMERITWVLVTGLTDKGIVLSIRTTNPKGNAEQVMRRILRGLGRGGGHGVMAGGFAPLADEQDPPSLRSKITARFLKALPYRRKESLKPLVT